MDDKKRKEVVKDQVVTSMAKKLANVSAVDDLEKIKKKRNRKPILGYVIAVAFTIVMTVSFYFAILSTEKTQALKFKAAQLTLRDNPLNRLKDALKNDVISADQFAMYCKDLLIRYDSLPDHYKTDKPIVLNDDIYAAITSVWFNIYPETKKKLTKELPGLTVKVEHYLDSIGVK